MQIKTVDGDREVASKGVAGTALGLGIAGTVGLLNQFAGGCGWGGGFLGGNRAGYCPMTHDAATSVDTREIGKFICMAVDRLHDVDDPHASEKAYHSAVGRISKHK